MSTVLLTHGDLDGMVSAILVLKTLETDDAIITIANGKTLHRELRKLHSLPPSEVFIADIPLLRTSVDAVLAAFRELKQRGTKVHVYDHHQCWNEVPEARSLCASYSVDISKSTAAAIVWYERHRGSDTGKEWLRLLSEKTNSESPDIVERFGLLAALMNPQNYPHTSSVIKALARGAALLPEYRDLSRRYYEEHVGHEKNVAESAEVLVAKSGRRVGWVDVRKEEGVMHVSPLVMKMHGVDVVATVIKNAVMLGGAAIDQGVDLSFLHGEHEVDGVRLSIAGHKSPVRLSPIGTQGGNEEFVAAARALILTSL